jgi:hypothetical protein
MGNKREHRGRMHNSSEDMGLNLSPGEGREKRTEKQDSIWAVRGSTGVEWSTYLKIWVWIWHLAKGREKKAVKRSDDMGNKREHRGRTYNS